VEYEINNIKKNGECAACLKYSVLIFVEKKIYKMQHLEGSGTPVLYMGRTVLNPLNAELNPIYHLLALLGAHHIFHVSGLRVKG
jgi:hypothetical protein